MRWSLRLAMSVHAMFWQAGKEGVWVRNCGKAGFAASPGSGQSRWLRGRRAICRLGHTIRCADMGNGNMVVAWRAMKCNGGRASIKRWLDKAYAEISLQKKMVPMLSQLLPSAVMKPLRPLPLNSFDQAATAQLSTVFSLLTSTQQIFPLPTTCAARCASRCIS